jgi:hypothetical protein
LGHSLTTFTIVTIKTKCTKWTICDKIPYHTDKSRYLEKLSENYPFSHVNKQKLSHLLGLIIDYCLTSRKQYFMIRTSSTIYKSDLLGVEVQLFHWRRLKYEKFTTTTPNDDNTIADMTLQSYELNRFICVPLMV